MAAIRVRRGKVRDSVRGIRRTCWWARNICRFV